MSTVFFIGEHPKTFEVQRHAHDYWELVYCTGGRGRFELEDGAAVPYQEGDAVAIPPGERHANTSDEGFTNIHVQLSNPPFPFRTAFRVADNSEGHLRAAFTQMLFYGQAEIERGGLILSALGDLIASYMLARASPWTRPSAPCPSTTTTCGKSLSGRPGRPLWSI